MALKQLGWVGVEGGGCWGDCRVFHNKWRKNEKPGTLLRCMLSRNNSAILRKMLRLSMGNANWSHCLPLRVVRVRGTEDGKKIKSNENTGNNDTIMSGKWNSNSFKMKQRLKTEDNHGRLNKWHSRARPSLSIQNKSLRNLTEAFLIAGAQNPWCTHLLQGPRLANSTGS